MGKKEAIEKETHGDDEEHGQRYGHLEPGRVDGRAAPERSEDEADETAESPQSLAQSLVDKKQTTTT